MKKMKPAIVPTILIAGVWFTVWVVYSGSLAINNYARIQGLPGLPPITGWMLFAARYGLLYLIGAIISVLVILTALRRTQTLQNALALCLLSSLVFVALGFAVFTIYIGACMCDAWRQWEKHDHPTKASTATNQPVLRTD